MKLFHINKLLMALALLPVAYNTAHGSADDAFAYQVLSFSDNQGNFTGWTLQADANSSKSYSRMIRISDDDRIVTCWNFSEYDNDPFPFINPQAIAVKKTTDRDWSPVTIGENGYTVLPHDYDNVKVTLHNTPRIITIGPPVNTENINLSDIDMTVISGEMTARGIKAEGRNRQSVEIALNHDSLQQLTQAYAKIVHRVNYLFTMPDGMLTEGHGSAVSMTVTAHRADGSSVELTPVSASSVFGSMVSQQYCLLPTQTVELRIKWEFTDIFGELDPERLEQTGNEEQSMVYDQIYIRSDEAEWDDNTPAQTQFCPYIAQKSHNDNKVTKADIALSLDRSTWYDVDGDGIMEWAFQADQLPYGIKPGLMKFNTDFAGDYYINDKFGTISGWINYGRGDNVDAYGPSEIYRIDNLSATTARTVDGALSIIDYNNDGRPDFWIKDAKSAESLDDKVLVMNTADEFVTDKLTLMTPAEYYDYVKQTGSYSGLGSGLSFVGDGPSTQPGSFASYAAIDINNDGYLDFIDTGSGRYLLNTGKGAYVSDNFGGTVVFRDFDSDGITDMLAYDSDEKSITVYLQRRNGETVTRTLFKGLNCSTSIWCRDFDRDGDIDILVPFNGRDNNGQSYLVMFENTGKGSFKKHENYIDGNCNFYECADWNSDGCYEVLSLTTDKTRVLDSYRIDGMKVTVTPDRLYTGEITVRYDSRRHDRMLVADIDNSGLQRFIFIDDMFTPSGTQLNTRPDRPDAPKVNYDTTSGEVTVSWSAGNDRQTAPLDLTYELRIGSAPGLCDIVWTDANADGTRRNISQGNCGYALQRRFDTSSWPKGTVYVSIQAIDDAGMGSQFSEYATFEKRQAPSAFTITATDYCTIGDECTVTLQNRPAPTDKYIWDVDGGTITSQSDTELHVTYATAGEKHIVLTVTSDDGSIATAERSIYISPVRFSICDDETGGMPTYGIAHAFDMDLDGKMELVTTPYNGVSFFEGNEAGVYNPVRRLFNTNINSLFGKYYSRIADINRDGLPDIVVTRSDITHFINEGDKSMTTSTVKGTYTVGNLPEADFDNDGVIDIPGYINSGDYVTYTEQKMPYGYNTHYLDFNGDGLVDILCVNSHEFTFYENKGNFTFELSQQVEVSQCEALIGSESIIADMDSDGNTDVIWTNSASSFGSSSYSSHLYIRWSDGNITEIPAPSGHLFTWIINTFDYDNNGCQDLTVSLDNHNTVVVYFYPDRSYDINNIESLHYTDAEVPFMRTDGHMGIGHTKLVGPANTAPTSPDQVRVTQNSNAIVVEWNKATDAETPAAALRYNISIRKKGAEGEGAYFISPLNNGMNGVPVPSQARLLTSTRFTIPANVIPAGEYEVKVQAVDTQWLQSDFSAPTTFTVSTTTAVDMPSSTMVNTTTRVNLNAGFSVTDIDFGTDAVIERSVGRDVDVYWTTTGLKTVTAGELSTQIYVHPALDASFNLPESIFLGAKVRVTCDNTHYGTWEISTGRDDLFQPIGSDFNKNSVTLTIIDDTTAELVFNNPGSGQWKVRHTLTEEYGTAQCIMSAYVTPMNPQAGITLADIDANTGKHRLSWNIPSDFSTPVSAINIYKETSRIGEYRHVATLPVDQTSFIDMESSPAVMSSRYAISYILPYGETGMSTVHKPIHVMINRGVGNAWNLSWSQYEGRDITTYRILRGSSPQALTCIAEVSGAITSYSDFEATDAASFYAVEILVDQPIASMRARSRAASIPASSRSNVVSTADAGSVILASSIDVISDSGIYSIQGDDTRSLQLSAFVYPVHASLRRVDWIITEGNDIATINQNGLLTASGNGTVTVRAYATDGSGVYGETHITASGISGVDGIEYSGNSTLNVTVHGSDISISGINASEAAPSTLRIFSVNGMLLHISKTTQQQHTVNISAYPAGMYIIRAENTREVQMTRFITR